MTTAAERAWSNFADRFEVPWRGARVLGFGSSSAPGLQHLGEHRDVASTRRLDSLAGRAELEDERFDVVLSSGVLISLRPSEQRELLEWLLAHLEPGGHCLLSTPTYLGPAGAGEAHGLATPLPHLVFAPPEVDALLARRGEPPLPYRNPSCAATYLVLFRRVGFQIADARIGPNPQAAVARERFPGRLDHFDPEQLDAERIHVHLRRPERPANLSALRPPA